MMPVKRRKLVWIAVVLVVLVPAIIAGLNFQRDSASRTLCTSNQRRLVTALLLYSQDHDGCPPPVATRMPSGKWRHWMGLLSSYIKDDTIGSCPANPSPSGIDRDHGYAFPFSYALNGRFHDTFSKGAFSLDGLELSAQTAFLVESGPERQDSPFASGVRPKTAAGYGDTGESPLAFPSPHGRKMNVAAADGHLVTVEVASYTVEGHDPVYGRLGGMIYNWNGGFLNGRVFDAPRN